MGPRVLAPSEVVASTVGASVRVGGRARWVGTADPVLHLFDAFGSIATDVRERDVADGALLVIEGVVLAADATRELGRARVISLSAPHAGALTRDTARLLDGGVAQLLARRERAAVAVRRYFATEGFLEVTTPVILPSPGLDLHLGAFAVETPLGTRFLSTSPEYQMKRLLVGGIPRCFQLAPCFRRDESGRHHNAEFTMLEWYRAFADVDEVIVDTEAIVTTVFEELAGADARGLDLSRPFERISVAQAFHDHAGVDEASMLSLAREDPERFFLLLVERVEPALALRARPMVLHRYPREMASLARLCPDDARYAERFEVYAASLELCNGFGELTDATEQRERFVRDQRDRAAAGLPVYPLDERFLNALAQGMPFSAGNALGFDRLVMLATGETSIDRVLSFPTDEL